MTNPRRAEYPYGRAQRTKLEGPQIPVTVVFSPEPNISFKYDGIVDTGSDGTFIPEAFIALVRDLGCTPLPIERSVTFGNSRSERREQYTLDLMLGEWLMEAQPMITLPGQCVIIGRDILNRYHLTLDGAAKLLTIRDVVPDD